MEKGASQSWQELLQEVIGEGRLDGTALREYFRPLEEWLRQENLRNNEFVGWNYDGDYCKHRLVIFFENLVALKILIYSKSHFINSIDTANLQVYGGFYNYASKNQSKSWIILFAIFQCILNSFKLFD